MCGRGGRLLDLKRSEFLVGGAVFLFEVFSENGIRDRGGDAAALEASPPVSPSTATAMAISGLSAGAKQMNQAMLIVTTLSPCLTRFWAVPVLPAIVTPGIGSKFMILLAVP